MRRLIVAAAFLLLACGAADAGPLRGAWVDADAKWLVHLDCEGFRASTLGKFILEHGDELGIHLGDLDEVEEEFGLDPRKDIFGVTIYGTSGDPGEKQVILGVASAGVEKALERLKEQEEVTTRKVEVGGYEITEVGDDGDLHALHLRPLDGGARTLVVMAAGSDQVVRALQVIDGKAPALSTGSKLLRTPREGSFVYAAATKLDGLDEMEPASELLRLSDGFAADIAEREGELSAEVTVSAVTERDATDMAQVLEGMTAMGRLMAARDPEMSPIRELVEGVRVRVEEKRLTLRVQFKAEDLIEKLKSLAAGHGHDDDADADADADDDNDDDGADGDGADDEHDE